jgi:hypothetical protein
MIKRLATLVLPAGMALAALIWAPDDWRAATAISLFWFALIWGHGYLLTSNVALLLAAGIWIYFLPDVTVAFVLALLPLLALSRHAMIRSRREEASRSDSEIFLTVRARNPVGGRGAG